MLLFLILLFFYVTVFFSFICFHITYVLFFRLVNLLLLYLFYSSLLYAQMLNFWFTTVLGSPNIELTCWDLLSSWWFWNLEAVTVWFLVNPWPAHNALTWHTKPSHLFCSGLNCHAKRCHAIIILREALYIVYAQVFFENGNVVFLYVLIQSFIKGIAEKLCHCIFRLLNVLIKQSKITSCIFLIWSWSKTYQRKRKANEWGCLCRKIYDFPSGWVLWQFMVNFTDKLQEHMTV